MRRPGGDVTLITYGGTLATTLEAAEQLAADGVDAEVIDLRTLRPLDTDTIVESVLAHPSGGRGRRRLAQSGSLSAEVSARITEHAFYDLDAPVGAGLQRRGADPLRPATSRRRPCPRSPPSSPRPAGSWGVAEMGEFRMPSLGADMEVGTILEWRIAPGDVVHRGDIVAVVDTEKSDIEVEVFDDGVVEELLVEPGVEVPVGTPLARIPAGADSVVDRPPRSPRPRPPPTSRSSGRRHGPAALPPTRGSGCRR